MNIKLRHITGPHKGPMGIYRDIQTPEDLLNLLSLNPLKQEPFVVHESPLRGLVAYVNESRLLVDCNCGSGVLIDAEWELGACFACGAIYRSASLVLPSLEDLQLLDRHLGTWHPAHRNYHPERESLASVLFLDGVKL